MNKRIIYLSIYLTTLNSLGKDMEISFDIIQGRDLWMTANAIGEVSSKSVPLDSVCVMTVHIYL